MKILQIVPSYKPAYIYGGPIESVSKLCEGLVKAGHKVDVLTTTANGKEELSIQEGVSIDVDGVNVRYFRRITKDPTHVSPALWKYLWLNVKSYDIVNIQSWWSILVIIAACICNIRGVKVIVSPRGMLSPYIFSSGYVKMKKVIHSAMGKRALSKSWFHATAEAEVKECKNVIKDWKGFMLPNIISLPEVPVIQSKNETFTLIFMSRIHPKKGIDILLEAISKVSFDVILKIAGSGEDEYVDQLKKLSIDLGIEDKVIWLGWLDREKKFQELLSSDLFVLTSLNENFANVVIESLHMGTPVLLSEEVALSSFVNEKDMGWVSSLSIEDVIAKLTSAYNDRGKLERIRETGRTVIEENFSAAKLVNSYVMEYQKIIDSK